MNNDPSEEIELASLRGRQSDPEILAVLVILHELIDSMPPHQRSEVIQRLEKCCSSVPERSDRRVPTTVGKFKLRYRSEKKFKVLLEVFLSLVEQE